MLHRRLMREAALVRLPLALSVAAGAAGALFAVLQAASLAGIADAIFVHHAQPGQLGRLFPLLALAIAGRECCNWLSDLWGAGCAATVKRSLRDRLLAAVGSAGRRTPSGEMAAVVGEGVDAVDATFSQFLPQLGIALLAPPAILVFVWHADWVSGLVLLVTGPLIPLFMWLIGSAAGERARGQWDRLRHMEAYFLDSLTGLATLKALGVARDHSRRIVEATLQYRHATLRVLRVAFLSAFALEMIGTIGTAIVAVQVGLRLLHSGIDFRPALLALVLAPEFYWPLRRLGMRFHAAVDGAAAADRIYEVLDSGQPAAAPAEVAVPGLAPIRLRGVAVEYADGRTALGGFSLDIEPGRTTELAGPSGMGKSTVAALLLGLVEPSVGRVLVGGSDLTTLDLDAWRSRISWAPQSPCLLDDTIEANIRLGRPDATDEQVQAAARAAGVLGFASTLPLGLATPVGDRATRLSAGQARRVALARAALRDGDLWILDEPWAGLDDATAASVRASLERLTAGKTVLLITHRQAGPAPAPVREPAPIPVVDRPGAAPARPDARRGVAWLARSLRPLAQPALLGVLLGAGATASSVLLLGVSAWLISKAALHPSIADLGVAIVGVRCFGIARGLFRYLERLVMHDATLGLLANLRARAWQALEPLAPGIWARRSAAAMVSRVVGDVDSLQQALVRLVAPPAVALAVVVGACGWLAWRQPAAAAAVTVAGMVAGLLLPWPALRAVSGLGAEVAEARSGLAEQSVALVRGYPELAVYGGIGLAVERARAVGASLVKAQLRLARSAALYNAIGGLACASVLWIAAAAAAGSVAAGALPGTLLAAVALVAVASLEPVQSLPAAWQSLEPALASAGRLADLETMEPPVPAPAEPRDLPEYTEVTLEGITVYYPGEPAPALRDFTLTLGQGRRIALVGPSGVGKSTVISTLLRLIEPTDGVYRVGGVDARELDPDRVRGLFAALVQPVHLFNTSILENLLMARPDATPGEVREALDAAALTQFVAGLPEGLATQVGELGMAVSGGEARRIALARALLQRTPYLVLDEPTEHLDAATGNAVMAGILRATEGRGLLLVTHNEAILEHMDEVIRIG